MWRPHHLASRRVQSESQPLFAIFYVHTAGAACMVTADHYSSPRTPVLGSPGARACTHIRGPKRHLQRARREISQRGRGICRRDLPGHGLVAWCRGGRLTPAELTHASVGAEYKLMNIMTSRRGKLAPGGVGGGQFRRARRQTNQAPSRRLGDSEPGRPRMPRVGRAAFALRSSAGI